MKYLLVLCVGVLMQFVDARQMINVCANLTTACNEKDLKSCAGAKEIGCKCDASGVCSRGNFDNK